MASGQEKALAALHEQHDRVVVRLAATTNRDDGVVLFRELRRINEAMMKAVEVIRLGQPTE